MLKIVLKDNKILNVDKRTENVLDLIKDILSDYSAKQEIKFDDIELHELEDIIRICELINYKPLNIQKPILNLKETKNKLFKDNNNKDLEKFYLSLDRESILKYLKISDFLQFKALEDLIYLKLLDSFKTKQNINEFLNLNLNEKDLNNIAEKYYKYSETYVDSLNDEQIENLLNEFD